MGYCTSCMNEFELVSRGDIENLKKKINEEKKRGNYDIVKDCLSHAIGRNNKVVDFMVETYNIDPYSDIFSCKPTTLFERVCEAGNKSFVEKFLKYPQKLGKIKKGFAWAYKTTRNENSEIVSLLRDVLGFGVARDIINKIDIAIEKDDDERKEYERNRPPPNPYIQPTQWEWMCALDRESISEIMKLSNRQNSYDNFGKYN
jgi:hypothetical protein